MRKIRRRRRTPTIAIIYHHVAKADSEDLPTPEHTIVDSDTGGTVRKVNKVLKSIGFNTQLIKLIGDDLSPLRKIRANYIFNLTDSRKMEMAIARVLSRLRIPFSGSPYDAIHNSNNKIRLKGIFEKHGIPTPRFAAIGLNTKLTRSILPAKFPLMVKPAYEHCSIGITERSVVTNFKQFLRTARTLRTKLRQMLLTEQYIRGKEVHIVVLERDNGTIALPPAEMKFRGKRRSKWNIYGFSEKWNERSVLYKNLYFESPAKTIPETILHAMQRHAIRAFYAMGFRDYARFDVRYNPKTRQYYFLEGNANPALSNNPDDALMASLLAAELTFEDFIRGIVANSLSPPPHRRRRRS